MADVELKTRVTSKVLALGSLPFISSLLLLYFAFDASRKFAPGDPARLLFAGIPTLIGGVILLSTLGIVVSFLGRSVTIKDETLIYQDPKRELHIDLGQMAYSPPRQGFLRALSFSDGEHSLNIPALFCSDLEFAQLVDAIELGRRKSRDARGNASYSL